MEQWEIEKACSVTYDCGLGELCDIFGRCVAIAGQSDELEIIRKACTMDSDCPEYTVYNDDYICKAGVNTAVTFSTGDDNMMQCTFEEFPTSSITVGIWLHLFKSSTEDTILRYGDVFWNLRML